MNQYLGVLGRNDQSYIESSGSMLQSNRLASKRALGSMAYHQSLLFACPPEVCLQEHQRKQDKYTTRLQDKIAADIDA